MARKKKQQEKQPPKPPMSWKLLGLVFAIPASIATRKLTDAAWYAARGTNPPRNPAAPGVGWGDALAWAAFSGITVALARLLAARGAATTYEKFTGNLPPGINAGP